jgi:hypothetical protein
VDAIELAHRFGVSLAEALFFARFLVESLDHAHARNRVGQHVGQPRPLAPNAREHPLHAVAV